MGLVDYSDSDSDFDGNSPAPAPAPAKPTAAASQPAQAKQPFQKLVDKANPGKILVNLPSTAAADDVTHSEDNPAKRRKIGGGSGGGGSGGRFGGFSSFLPPPKPTSVSVSKPAGGVGGAKAAAPRVGVNLRTSSEAAFSRDGPSSFGDDKGDDGSGSGSGSGLRLPAPRASSAQQPSIPEGQKPEEEVKLVGKPLMFKPLSVSRKPGKKSGGAIKAASAGGAPPMAVAVGAQGAGTGAVPGQIASPAQKDEAAPQTAAPRRKKVSLFSMADDIPPPPSTAEAAVTDESAAYEAEFTSYDNSAFADGFTAYDTQQYQQQHQYPGYAQPQSAITTTTTATSSSDPNSLDSIADDLNLSAAARRELFGRGGPPAPGSGRGATTARSVINFNMDEEYRHNEELRASGALDQQRHNPLRAIKPGKHSLQQLVNQVQSQRDALEENFAKNRSTQKSAGAKYGFR